MALPHNQLLETRSPLECFEWLMQSNDEELYLAVSQDFYEPSVNPDTVYGQYLSAYQQYLIAFSALLGAPEFSGDWRSTGYPDWAVGEQVTVWSGSRGDVWLRLHHEDRECPILVALAKIPADDVDDL
jgi:hypothetical protein